MAKQATKKKATAAPKKTSAKASTSKAPPKPKTEIELLQEQHLNAPTAGARRDIAFKLIDLCETRDVVREEYKLAITCTCSKCSADVGEWCYEGKGRKMHAIDTPHEVRVEDARKAKKLIDSMLAKNAASPSAKEYMVPSTEPAMRVTSDDEPPPPRMRVVSETVGDPIEEDFEVPPPKSTSSRAPLEKVEVPSHAPPAGNAIFVRWPPGKPRPGVLMRYTPSGGCVVKLLAVDPKGLLTGEMGSERTIKLDDLMLALAGSLTSAPANDVARSSATTRRSAAEIEGEERDAREMLAKHSPPSPSAIAKGAEEERRSVEAQGDEAVARAAGTTSKPAKAPKAPKTPKRERSATPIEQAQESRLISLDARASTMREIVSKEFMEAGALPTELEMALTLIARGAAVERKMIELEERGHDIESVRPELRDAVDAITTLRRQVIDDARERRRRAAPAERDDVPAIEQLSMRQRQIAASKKPGAVKCHVCVMYKTDEVLGHEYRLDNGMTIWACDEHFGQVARMIDAATEFCAFDGCADKFNVYAGPREKGALAVDKAGASFTPPHGWFVHEEAAGLRQCFCPMHRKDGEQLAREYAHEYADDQTVDEPPPPRATVAPMPPVIDDVPPPRRASTSDDVPPPSRNRSLDLDAPPPPRSSRVVDDRAPWEV